MSLDNHYIFYYLSLNEKAEEARRVAEANAFNQRPKHTESAAPTDYSQARKDSRLERWVRLNIVEAALDEVSL